VKDSTDGVVLSAKPNQLPTVSERKLKANRENAKKSTGPRTAIGKTFSCRNALKEGLFVRQITDFEALSEDPMEYQELINGLWDQYQPIGKGEEIEVERIAVCYWKLKRVWRYENAVNLAARRDFVGRELNEQAEYCEKLDKENQAVIGELQNARKEIEDTGQVSQELRQRIFAISPGFEAFWAGLEKDAEQWMEDADVSKVFGKLKPQKRTQLRDIYTVAQAMALLETLPQRRGINVIETAIGQHAIPHREALDKILRYEGAVNRDLGRALDRLDWLQRRRKGEPLAPSVNVRVTR